MVAPAPLMELVEWYKQERIQEIKHGSISYFYDKR